MQQPEPKSGIPTGPYFQFENVVLLGALGAAVLVYVVIGFYARPVSDAYSFSIGLDRYGFFGSQVDWYMRWSGRFAVNFAATVFSGIFNVWDHYFLVGISVLVMVSTAFYRLLTVLGRHQFGRCPMAIAALFLLILYIDGLPSISQSVYWLSNVTVLWAASISMIGFSLLIESWDQLDERGRRIQTWLAAACMFYGCGTYETLAAVNLTVLAAGLSWSRYFRESSRRAWGWALALGIVGLAIDVCAPGTWNRATYELGREYTVERNGLGEAFVLSFFFVCRSLVEWTTRPAVFSALIVAAGIVWPLTEELLPKCAAKRRWLLLLPVFWFGLMVFSLWPLLLMIPHVFPRVAGLTYLVFLLGWLTTLPVYLAFAKNVLRPPLVRFRGFVQWGCLFAIWGAKLLFVLCLYKTGNTAQAWSDLWSGSASAYARFHDTLHRKAEEAVASGQQHLVITKQMSQHPRVPTLSIGMEYNARADKWAFNAFAWYHGLESVKVE